MRCAWQVELDKECNRVLGRHWPDVERHGDVTECGAGNLRSVDLICGGFPCQDLSVAGNRAGLAGERSGLWTEFARILGELKPRWCIIENVPGLHSSWSPTEPPPRAVEGGEWEVEEDSDFETLLCGLSELGYWYAGCVLDSQYFRVPQRRDRVFVVGHFGAGGAPEILFEPESVRGDSPPCRGARERVAGTLTRGALDGSSASGGDGREGLLVAGTPSARNKGGGGLGTDCEIDGGLVCGAVSSKWAKGSVGPAGDECYNLVAAPLTQNPYADHASEEANLIAHSLRGEGFDAREDGTGRGTPIVVFDPTQITSRENRCNPRAGDPCHPLAKEAHPPVIAFSQKDNGRDCGEVSPALRSMSHRESHANGGGQVAIAFTERSRDAGRTFETQEELAYALTNPGSGGRTHSRSIAQGLAVRRLTPRECERLQGFPDDWTRWDAAGRELSDSARYRMLGNAVTTHPAEWIASRIVQFEEAEAVA
jgi:DNA (cytosine-5)-methyltransferase 1